MELSEFLEPKIAELVGLAFFAVVLDADDAAGVLVVVDVGGDDAIDLDPDVGAFAGDAVGVPVVAFEGVSGAFAECGLAFGVALDGADEPGAAAFVVESAGPFALGVAIDLGLVSENLVRLGVGTEHEAAVGGTLREEDFSFEDEVAVGVFGDEEELAVSGEVDLAIDDVDLAPGVWVFPAGGGSPIEERFEIRFFGGAGDEGGGEGDEEGFGRHGWRISGNPTNAQGSRSEPEFAGWGWRGEGRGRGLGGCGGSG